MTAPTITSITPSFGRPGGRYLLRIEGADFELPHDPPSTGYVGSSVPISMEVEIDGRKCSNVKVYSSGILTCNAPSFRGDPENLNADPGYSVDVVIRNLTGPEETTYTDSFTYKRSDLTRGDGTLRHVVRTLIRELRRQVLDNVSTSYSVDYDKETGDQLSIVELAGSPAIALFGPQVIEDKFYRSSIKPQTRNLSILEYNKFDIPYVVTLSFQANVVGTSTGEVLNLIQDLMLFFRNNKQLGISSDPLNPNSEIYYYEMFVTKDPSTTGQANESDVREMEAEFEIRGIPIDEDDFQNIHWGMILDDPANVELQTEQEE